VRVPGESQDRGFFWGGIGGKSIPVKPTEIAVHIGYRDASLVRILANVPCSPKEHRKAGVGRVRNSAFDAVPCWGVNLQNWENE